MKDDDKDDINLYEFFGAPDMDYDGDIDAADVMMYQDELDNIREMIDTTYERAYDIDENDDGDDDDDDDDDDEEEDDSDDDDDDGDDDDDDDDESDDDDSDEDNDESDDDDDDTDDDESGDDEEEQAEDIDNSFEVSEAVDERQAKIEERLSEAREKLAYLTESGVKSKEDKLHFERCKFIVDNLSIASKYCDHHYGFEIVEAVVNEYPLPTEFLEYYDCAKMGMDTFLDKLIDYDVDLSIKVCVWVFLHFSQYRQYDTDNFQTWVKIMFDYSVCKNDEYVEKMLNFLGDSYGFLLELIADMDKVIDDDFICAAIKFKRYKLAKDLCKAILSNNRIKLAERADLIERTVKELTYDFDKYGEEGLVFLENDILPMAKEFNSKILNKQILEWEKAIKECKEDNLDSQEEEEDEELSLEVESIFREQGVILSELNKSGEFIAAENAPKFFDFAFKENANSYSVLCKKILEQYGEIRPINDGYIVGKMPTDDLQLMAMFVVADLYVNQYFRSVIQENGVGGEVFKINKPMMEFLVEHVRPIKLRLLEDKKNYISMHQYYPNSHYIEIKDLWREWHNRLKERAKSMFLDYKERGLVAHAYVYERQLYSEIQRRFRDAKYAYRAEWLGDRLVDIFIPSKKIAVIYNRKVPELVSAEEVEEGNKYIRELEKICKDANVRLVVWRYHDPINEDAILDNIS